MPCSSIFHDGLVKVCVCYVLLIFVHVCFTFNKIQRTCIHLQPIPDSVKRCRTYKTWTNQDSQYHPVAFPVKRHHCFCLKAAEPLAFMKQLKMCDLSALCIHRRNHWCLRRSQCDFFFFSSFHGQLLSGTKLNPSVGFRPYKTRELVSSVSLISLPPYPASHALFLLQ